MPECVMEQACAVEEQDEGVPPIYLEPFLHQVGGHSSMLRFDDTTVCKPLVPREQYFYETMPEEMKEFTPQYRGVTKVQFAEDSDGYLALVAYPVRKKATDGSYLDTESNNGGTSPVSGGEGTQSDSDSESPSSSTECSTEPRQRFRIRRSGSIEMEATKKAKFKVHNPWYLRCYKVQLEKMKNSGMGTRPTKFILLENLASDYKWPCILDLKMGTRQHGDDASEEKRLLHTQKCEVSTSSSLGTRLCGMQSYQAATGQYICRDKYYGRTLSVDGMRDTMHQFLHNGYTLRHDILDPLVTMLRRLHHVLASHNTFRFYSSSLLIMYDGGDWSDNGAAASSQGPTQCNTCRDKAVGESDDKQSAYGDSDMEMLCDDSDSRDSETAGSDKNWNSSCPHMTPHRPKVDIRMIDFAHVTHQGFRGDRIVHTGPDLGYLFGLENLIHMFEDIKRRGSERGWQEGAAASSSSQSSTPN